MLLRKVYLSLLLTPSTELNFHLKPSLLNSFRLVISLVYDSFSSVSMFRVVITSDFCQKGNPLISK